MTRRPVAFVRRLGVVSLALAALACAGRKQAPPPTPLDRMDADLRTAARDFVEGTLSGRAYLDLSIDRAGKARRLRSDPAWRDALAAGDRDRDHVPDSYDRCETPEREPTDEHGCPLPPSPCRPENPNDPACAPTADDDRAVRRLLDELTLMFNPRCESSPTPQSPDPLEWGRGVTPAGFNFAVTQVTNQAPDCELFYEIEARYASPTNPNDLRFAHALFRASEDINGTNPQRATFHVPMPESVVLTKGREGLRELFKLAAPIQWRVRAVNGALVSSSWSAPREQGPASGGVRE